jgi:hypothetical protein
MTPRVTARRNAATVLVTAAGVVLLAACGSTVATQGSQTLGPVGTQSNGTLDNGLGAPIESGGPRSAPEAAGALSAAAGRRNAVAASGPAATSTSTRQATAFTTRGSGVGRGPLKIGFLYPSNGAANAALGVTTSASSDPKSIMAALVGGLNKHAGLAGRRLDVDYYTVDSTSSDYSSQAEAACAHFTQDAPVPVVLDVAFGNRYGMATCLAKHGVADFGTGTTDSVSDNAVRLYAAPNAMTSTRRYPAVIAGLHATRYVTSSNKIGVLLEDCPYLQRAYQQAILPEISRLGLNRVDTQSFQCTTGFSSAGPASSAIQSAVLRFRSDGVDRLLMVSDYEQVALLLIANDAESQGWRPGYMLSSTAQAEVMRSNIPSGQQPQMRGVGWSPGLDVDDPHTALSAADRRCLELIKEGGIAVAGWQNTYIATAECSEMFFLAAALQASGGKAQASALMPAVDSLGTSYISPGIVDGRTFFRSGRRDGPAAVAPFAYVSGCGCLRYTGGPEPVS